MTDPDGIPRTCSVPGCLKPLRSSGAKLCAMHYHRQYRHGSVDLVAARSRISASKGRRYRTVYRPGHPLAAKWGNVYVHRLVLFDLIGYGPHRCHWCEAAVNWAPKGAPGELQVDHLDGYGDNNEPDNLVASCRTCNSLRGMQARSEALRKAGWWSQHDTVEVTSPRRPLIA